MATDYMNFLKKSSMNTVLFVNATVGFSENLFLVYILGYLVKNHEKIRST